MYKIHVKLTASGNLAGPAAKFITLVEAIIINEIGQVLTIQLKELNKIQNEVRQILTAQPILYKNKSTLTLNVKFAYITDKQHVILIGKSNIQRFRITVLICMKRS